MRIKFERELFSNRYSQIKNNGRVNFDFFGTSFSVLVDTERLSILEYKFLKRLLFNIWQRN